MTPIIRPATAEDIKEFLGDKPLLGSVIAYAVEYKGEVVAVASRSLSDKHSIIFSNIKEVDAPKGLIFKTALKVLKMLIHKGMPFYAIRSDEIPNAGKFLEHLGFYQVENSNTYKYEVLSQ